MSEYINIIRLHTDPAVRDIAEKLYDLESCLCGYNGRWISKECYDQEINKQGERSLMYPDVMTRSLLVNAVHSIRIIAEKKFNKNILFGGNMSNDAIAVYKEQRPPSLIGGDFSEALLALKHGYKVARSGWNGKNMFLFLVPGSTFIVNRPPLLGIYPEGTEIKYHAHVDMRTADGQIVPWLCSQTDLLASDWGIVP